MTNKSAQNQSTVQGQTSTQGLTHYHRSEIRAGFRVVIALPWGDLVVIAECCLCGEIREVYAWEHEGLWRTAPMRTRASAPVCATCTHHQAKNLWPVGTTDQAHWTEWATRKLARKLKLTDARWAFCPQCGRSGPCEHVHDPEPHPCSCCWAKHHRTMMVDGRPRCEWCITLHEADAKAQRAP